MNNNDSDFDVELGSPRLPRSPFVWFLLLVAVAFVAIIVVRRAPRHGASRSRAAEVDNAGATPPHGTVTTTDEHGNTTTEPVGAP